MNFHILASSVQVFVCKLAFIFDLRRFTDSLSYYKSEWMIIFMFKAFCIFSNSSQSNSGCTLSHNVKEILKFPLKNCEFESQVI